MSGFNPGDSMTGGMTFGQKDNPTFLDSIANGLWGITLSVYDAGQKAALPLVATLGLDAIQQVSLAWSSLGFTAGLGAVTLVVNLISLASSTALQDVNNSVNEFHKNYPKLRIIGLLFAIAASLLLSYYSVNAGLGLGFVTGAIFSIGLSAAQAKLVQDAARGAKG